MSELNLVCVRCREQYRNKKMDLPAGYVCKSNTIPQRSLPAAENQKRTCFLYILGLMLCPAVLKESNEYELDRIKQIKRYRPYCCDRFAYSSLLGC